MNNINAIGIKKRLCAVLNAPELCVAVVLGKRIGK